VKAYLALLRIADYRLLWTALVLNLIGDGATFTAISWITVTRSGAAGLGVLGVCFTLPVLLGGAVIGPLLDRYSRRRLLVLDSAFRGAVVAAIPLCSALHVLAMWQLYAFATVYGLLKIIPLAGTPAIIPDLVPPQQLQTAMAMESTAMGAANIAGPAIGAGLIVAIGAPNVLLLDAATYLAFSCLIAAIRAPLGRPEASSADPAQRGTGWGPVVRLLLRDRFLMFLTIGFALFNISAGALLVVLPWLARFQYRHGAALLGLMLAVGASAELAGSVASGAVKTSQRQMFRVGLLQIVAGGVLLLMVPRGLPWVLAALVCSGILAGPLVVMGGVVRLTRIPQALRGRAMTLMRTTMSGALPFGAAVGGLLLDHGSYTALIVVVALLAAVPGVLTALSFRDSDFRTGLVLAPEPEPTTT
jgi:predicted MFS family arabinose efflux permease